MNKKTIYDLYYGNINPCDIDLKCYPKLLKTNAELLQLMNKIEERLGPDYCHLFEEYNDIVNKQYVDLQYISFEDGLKLGLSLAVETFLEDKNK